MTISVVILTRNEAKNIERCLRSVQWADEIIVVDAESEDETREIAKRMGAKVIIHLEVTCELYERLLYA